MFFFKKRPYKIKVHGRAGLTYFEGERSLEIFSELLSGKFDVVIYLSRSAKWSDGSEVTEEDRARIKKNIAERMKWTKIDWD